MYQVRVLGQFKFSVFNPNLENADKVPKKDQQVLILQPSYIYVIHLNIGTFKFSRKGSIHGTEGQNKPQQSALFIAKHPTNQPTKQLGTTKYRGGHVAPLY